MARILVEILNILLLLLRDSMIIKIYVSSTNSLVDMEIKRYGFTPVRFGSEKYIKTFRKCKYVLSMVTRGSVQVFRSDICSNMARFSIKENG